MFVIMAYDVNVGRVNQVLKIGRRYLNWVQNSLLEGELTAAQLARLKSDVKKVIDEDEDSVVFYLSRRQQYLERQIMGQDKGGVSLVI
ncbi:CRISPR-associated endonuclease Cas2 [Dehalococcoidia bacterium]|nr:CRISPR-associated endonuclease Cas2 [Dehalococcoidia bacterium]MCL0059108.1 CRISPR-associated endonuclease Cas2 [Dehalococcoidia bacterium]MCL0072681.1 CRISPR-associated endonuclease Cas2 [Dehalococcoidia bacterium]MCL0087282.1 CRISPR-associated endonuclease Cas2 [Dehalococcoidia bacterium]MCL0098744.1 CRISPR-associated endonuclease Cas2 [Dehalococcoidia bacterium]